MKRKILGLLIVTLLLATIPLAACANAEVQSTIAKKKTFVSGFVAFAKISFGGKFITFFAISVRHGELGGNYGIWRLQLITMPNKFMGIMTTPFILGMFN